ncbi:histidine kinase [Ornithinimicrobium faecis]|uniref:Histidine kinase n=1 Tax=Ornithinimicrobium faecis TaxID=2934158 RepID=A0ABY4YWT5_9MICO|nr:histidine kinase [Ornithinimicrobium sp. HY1793]USQ81205.1 histidine kinase [Ornithinimicrobium sp. HY1793]
MERRGSMEIWAALSLLVVCVLVGTVEGAMVWDRASGGYFAGWLAIFVLFLVLLGVAAARRTPATAIGRLALVAPAVLAASAVALLSPNPGGMSLILLVFGTAICAHHLDLRLIAIVISWNALVIVAALSGVGPLVEGSAPIPELALATMLYTLLQVASAVMVWSQERVAEALRDVTVAHVELQSTSALLAESSQAQERLRISRELHDVLGHQLTVLSVELEVATHQVDGPAREHVVRARTLAKELLGDVRSVVGTERERSFDLPSALARVAQEVPHPRVHLDIDPALDVGDGHSTTLVRAVQEVTTNTIRHAEAENLWISLASADGIVRLEARDDGRGAHRLTAGHGLNGLRERVEAQGGRLDIAGSPGFKVLVELPAALPVDGPVGVSVPA